VKVQGSASRPLKAERLISHTTGQSRMHMGHMPLIVLVSFSRVYVPTVDFPFSYEPFLCVLSLICPFLRFH